jgi:uncharacterized protein YbjT (DUF2867 family)
MANTLKVILTGASGMVGEGVLIECLQDNRVESVLTLNRKSLGIMHPKLKEVVLQDLYDLSSVETNLAGYTTCFYCLGTTSVGKTEEQYSIVTNMLTMMVATTLCRLNPSMVFCYISAAGADNTEHGKTMWARVKGKTENELKELPFNHVYAFRPFLLTPNRGSKKTHGFYKYISWFFPLGRLLFPNGFCTLKELGLSMITVGFQGFSKMIVKPKDMVKLAKAH